MTIAEKKKAIFKHCEKCFEGSGCPECDFSGNEYCEKYNESNCPDDIAEKWYELFFGEERGGSDIPTNIRLHTEICEELKDLYKRKNADYGDSFHKTFIEEGMAMARIRLTDKLERFKRLTKSGEQNVKDESIRDTLIDLANYAIMTIVELER